MRARSGDQAWERRRATYESLLGDEGSFVLIAERDEQAVGYALVHLIPGSEGYESGAQVGEVESLSVLPVERGQGLGTALLDAVESELARSGIAELVLSVVAGNDAAMRFYERRGMAVINYAFATKVSLP